MSKKSLISRMVSRHVKDEEVRLKLISELESYFDFQENHSSMLTNTISSMSIDIEKYKDELERNQEQMVKQSKMSTIGEVTATLSHEFNNQMMVLAGNCELIELINDNQIKNPKISKFLEYSKKTLYNMSNLIKNIRKFSHHSSDETLNVILDNPNSIVEEAINVCAHMLKNTNLKIESSTSVPKDFQCYLPSSELGQVLLNLVKNGHDHVITIPDHSEHWIKVDSAIVDNQIRITVSNGGVMPNEVKEKLFQPFFTTKEVGKGTGIGLSLGRKIVESVKGKIFLDTSSEVISFVIELPVIIQKTEILAA